MTPEPATGPRVVREGDPAGERQDGRQRGQTRAERDASTIRKLRAREHVLRRRAQDAEAERDRLRIERDDARAALLAEVRPIVDEIIEPLTAEVARLVADRVAVKRGDDRTRS